MAQLVTHLYLQLHFFKIAKQDAVDAYAEVISDTASTSMAIEIDEDAWTESASVSHAKGLGACDRDPHENIIDIWEYDVPYYLKKKVKCADPVFMAFNVKTTKALLKFPDQAINQVMMISYMVDGQDFLITN
ncbi:hypothetical protein C0995_013004 [Termitomyces sp. Mi166|nr:hypothetical protein C0995_013004 [Termitomyces sp. Mi166\